MSFVSNENAEVETSNQKNGFEIIEVLHDEEILYDYLFKGQMEHCPFSVCRKVYKRNLFIGIEFPVGKINEDIITNFRVLKSAKTLVHISDIGYYCFQDNSESITSGFLRKKDFDLLDASRELCKLSPMCSDKRIRYLDNVKLARSYFSLFAKVATAGIADDISKNDLKFLTKNLRKNYNLVVT